MDIVWNGQMIMEWLCAHYITPCQALLSGIWLIRVRFRLTHNFNTHGYQNLLPISTAPNPEEGTVVEPLSSICTTSCKDWGGAATKRFHRVGCHAKQLYRVLGISEVRIAFLGGTHSKDHGIYWDQC